MAPRLTLRAALAVLAVVLVVLLAVMLARGGAAGGPPAAGVIGGSIGENGDKLRQYADAMEKKGYDMKTYREFIGAARERAAAT